MGKGIDKSPIHERQANDWSNFFVAKCETIPADDLKNAFIIVSLAIRSTDEHL